MSNRHAQFPEELLDAMIARLKLKNDLALARLLGMTPPSLSKIRNGQVSVSSNVLVRMHEVSDIPIRDLRALAGDFRPHTGKSAAIPERPFAV